MGASVVSARKVTEEGEWLAVCGDLNGDTVIASHSSQNNACVARGKGEVMGVDTMRTLWEAIELRGRWRSVDEWAG